MSMNTKAGLLVASDFLFPKHILHEGGKTKRENFEFSLFLSFELIFILIPKLDCLVFFLSPVSIITRSPQPAVRALHQQASSVGELYY